MTSTKTVSEDRPLRIATIGGGGGHAQVLKGLKALPGLAITAVCPGTDSGGSTGVLAREYGAVGWLGDLTKCIAALTPDETLADALIARFEGGPFHGHSLKNILMLGLARANGVPLQKAIWMMERMCGVDPLHHAVPASAEPAELCATLTSGGEIAGETNIDTLARNPLWSPDIHGIERIFLRPAVRAWGPATEAIVSADRIVVCPGDLYSSILPVFLPQGMARAFRRTKARIVVVLNIMTKRGETDGYRAEDFVREIENKIGRRCNAILYNGTPVPEAALARYRMERKVRLSMNGFGRDPRLVKVPLLGITPEGWLYHDPRLLARALAKALK